MDFLDSIFKLWLSMLDNLVNDNRLGALFWMFLIVMTMLLTIQIWRGVTSWKH